jgi:acyl-CoA synthetase (NDP forming)
MSNAETSAEKWKRFLEPARIAIVGASEGGTPGKILQELQSSFKGTVTPVNPNRTEVYGVPCVPSLKEVDPAPDVVLAAVRRELVPEVLRQAGERGVAGAVIYATGFAERDELGRKLQREVQEIAQSYDLLVMGPNCFGYLAVHQGVSLYGRGSVAPEDRGSVALISQSGGLSIALYVAGRHRGLNFNYVFATGNEAVLSVEDFLEQVLLDKRTRVVVLLAEGFRNPAKLIAMAWLARTKQIPVVVLKCGRSAIGQVMAGAHTATLAGNAEVHDSVFRQCGFIVVRNLVECLEVAELMDRRRKSSKPGALAITVSGGDTTLISDLAERTGVPLPDPSATVVEAVRAIVPGFAQPRNPFEASSSVVPTPEDAKAVLRALLRDPEIDIFLVRPLLPSEGGRSSSFDVNSVAALATETDKTVILVSRGLDIMPSEWAANRRKWPLPFLHEFEYALRAVKALTDWQRWLESDVSLDRGGQADAPRWREDRSLEENLRAAGLPFVEQARVRTVAEAKRAADQLGYPVVVKADPDAVAHKVDAGLVALDLADADAVGSAATLIARRLADAGAPDGGMVVQKMVRDGVEVLVGMVRDPVFGPAVVVGAGGILTELIADTSIRLAPVSEGEAREMIGETRVSRLLAGLRGRKPADVEDLASVIARFSQLVARLPPEITAIDLNPVIVGKRGDGSRIVDSLVTRSANEKEG